MRAPCSASSGAELRGGFSTLCSFSPAT
jgi:hypothetical protein